MAHHLTTLHTVFHLMDSLTLGMDLALGDEDVVVGVEVVAVAQKVDVATREERSVTVIQLIQLQRPILEKFLLGHHFYMLLEKVLPHYLDLWG